MISKQGRNMCQFPVLMILVTSAYFKSVTAHVSLTFPPARRYDLDFLDNIRTKPPCGMPRGVHGTTLMAGVPVNISWHLAYPHRGGYRLELLDKHDNFVMDLIKRDKSQDYIQGDPTAQWQTVTIPTDLICETCTIRLLRQASEWANEYRFWSCADVKIQTPSRYLEDCSRHGQVILVGGGDGCKCDRGWWGPRCQYEEECHSSNDCGKGTCVDLGGTALPRKQCFCPPGLHGIQCSLTNNAKLATKTSLNLSTHTKKELSDKMSLYYKKIDKEIEFVLVMNGTSYGALGWRPAALNKSCKLWPQIESISGRVKRQSLKEKKHIYKPNETLLRPLKDYQKSRTQPEVGSGSKRHKQIPTLEKQQESPSYYSRKGSQSIPEVDPEPEVGDKSSSSKTKIEELVSEPEGIAKINVIPKIEQKLEKAREKPKLNSEKHPATAEPHSEPEAEFDEEPKSEDEPKSESEPESESQSKLQFGTQTTPSKSFLKGPPVPEVEPEPESSAEPEPEKHSPEPESEKSSVEPAPEKQSAEPEPEKHFAEPEPEKHSPEPENHSPESESEKSSVEPEPEKQSAKPEPENHSAEPEPEKYSPKPEPEKNYAEPELENNAKHSAEPEPEKNYAEPEPEIGSTVINGKSQYAPKGDFHAMDCTDIIIGAARGVNSRILDYYTRDRSTPRLDEFWTDQGSNSITSATGWQTREGQTVIIFRRKMKSSEITDHDIEGGMHIIWARGQEQDQYVHSPHSGLEKDSPSIPNFYAEDEIKYHGHRGQRGSTFIEF